MSPRARFIFPAVLENPQASDLSGQLPGVGLRVAFGHAQKHEYSAPDLPETSPATLTRARLTRCIQARIMKDTLSPRGESAGKPYNRVQGSGHEVCRPPAPAPFPCPLAPTFMQPKLPIIAVTQGDPAGIGPEIIVAAWKEPAVHQWCRPLVVGHPEVLRRAVGIGQADLRVVAIDAPEKAAPSPGVMPCIACGSDDVLQVAPGKLDARAGQAAYEAIVAAARLALDGRVDAITTAPLQKEALQRAGHRYPGHTELLAELCGTSDFAMMLYLGPGEAIASPAGLAVVHVTLHTALGNVFQQLSEDAILAKARLADRFMARLIGAGRGSASAR